MARENGSSGKRTTMHPCGRHRKGLRDNAGNTRGTLIIIGGGEDREGEKKILGEVASRVGDGKLVVTTVASHQPEGYFEQYLRAFTDLGLREEQIVELDVRTRGDASAPEKLRKLEGATAVFFSGGDQLRITSQIGDTPIWLVIEEVYLNGGVIAGTSAGASCMSETMLIQGSGKESHRVGDVRMAPGMGLIQDVIIDQHFAQRGRMGRLLGAVAQNPRELGVGIDEDTAIIVESEDCFHVIGSGAVYVVDGTGVTKSNIAEDGGDIVMSIYDVRLHVLAEGDRFDLVERRPSEVPRSTVTRVEAAEEAAGEQSVS